MLRGIDLDDYLYIYRYHRPPPKTYAARESVHGLVGLTAALRVVAGAKSTCDGCTRYLPHKTSQARRIFTKRA